MATELAKSEEITDIWVYKNELMNSINAINYKVAFPILCNTLLRFVKRRIEPNLDTKHDTNPVLMSCAKSDQS